MTRPSRLRVFIDGAIMKPQLGGIATYISELTRAMGELPDVVVCLATSTTGGFGEWPSVDVVELPVAVRRFDRRQIWRERRMAQLVTSWRADVVIAPTVELPVRRLPVPAIMVIHDLGAVQMPELYGRLRWLRFAAGIPIACRRAAHVVCVSQATQSAFRACFPSLAATRCSVIGEVGRVLPSVQRCRRRPPFILSVGSLLRHKNVDTLVAAMNEPALRHVELILAGPIDDRERRLVDTWRGATQSRISHEGYVDIGRLAKLYAGAAAVALPSLYEGFGLTLLEAMKSGAPVVASSIPAHREVGGDTAVYVDAPRSATAWAQALRSVVDDQAFADTLGHAAALRAGFATWATVAEEMVALARRLVEARSV